MKRFLFSILFLFSIPCLSFAQDTIVKKGGALRLCAIEKETSDKVYFTFEQGNERVRKFLRKQDIEAIKYATFMGLDTIVKNDGVVRICTIQREDSANVYVSIRLDGKKTAAFVKKANIQTIRYAKLTPRKSNQYFSPEAIFKRDSIAQLAALYKSAQTPATKYIPDSTSKVTPSAEVAVENTKPQQSPPTKESNTVVTKNPNTSLISNDYGSIGLGIGLDYGGIIGGNLLLFPQKNIGLFVGGGYAIAGFGYNVGTKIRFTTNIGGTPYLLGMYGYNTVIKVANADQYSKLFYGFTFGIGYDLKLKSTSKGHFTFALLLPIRGSEVQNYIDDLKNNHGVQFSNTLSPVTISIGYRILFR